MGFGRTRRDPEFRRRFAREVAAARAVDGRYTAQVLAAGMDDPAAWLSTVFVPGMSLAEAVAEHGPFPEASALALARGLAAALAAVHTAGLVHRDLKPSNVLLGPVAHSLLARASSALEADSDPSLTATASPPYAPTRVDPAVVPAPPAAPPGYGTRPCGRPRPAPYGTLRRGRRRGGGRGDRGPRVHGRAEREGRGRAVRLPGRQRGHTHGSGAGLIRPRPTP
ncbi:hypothetical protein ACFVRB_33015 [Streptomyces nojiriensis]|uniref:protein kinase domain-containing protein n=1 Tax=Streptomyces nojiriensis TaxID=66374 RepID=UPI0036DE79F6